MTSSESAGGAGVPPVLRYVEREAAGGAGEFSLPEREVIDTLNRKVAAGTSLEATLDFVFDVTRGVCPSDRMSVAFLEDGGRRAVSHWTRTEYEPALLRRGFAADLAGSSLAEVVRSGRPRVIDDLVRYLETHPDSPSTRLLVREGVRSSLSAPLIVDGRPVGFLFRSSRRPGVFTEHQVRIHLAVAERLGQAVEKAYRIEQLESANAAYLEMLAFVTHELKSPLAALVSMGTTLTGGFAGEMEARHRDMVERMVGRAKGLLGLIGDYLNLARLEGGGLVPEFRRPVDLGAAVLDPAIETVGPLLEEARTAFRQERLGDLAGIECDPGLLQIVLVNLLGNAVKYGRPEGAVELRAERLPDRLEVSVWNEGPGFPESERPRLFRRFSRLRTPELMQRKGSGVGLYVSWQIVQLHGGRIRAESEPGRWARFSFRLPQPLPPRGGAAFPAG